MRLALKALIAGTWAVQGCGDCVSLGYPSAYLTVVEAGSGLPVGLGGAILVFESTGQFGRRDSVDTSHLNSISEYTLCCVSGRVQVHLLKQGFAAWDSTLTIGTSWGCDIPDAVRVTIRLQRLEAAFRHPEAASEPGELVFQKTVNSAFIGSLHEEFATGRRTKAVLAEAGSPG